LARQKGLSQTENRKVLFAMLGVLILSIIIIGIKGYFSLEVNALKELSIGFI